MAKYHKAKPAEAPPPRLVEAEVRLPDGRIPPKVPQRPVDEGLFDRRPPEHQEELFPPKGRR